MRRNIKIRIILLLLLISPFALGQKMVNSPYARFGPGILQPQGVFKSRSMGGAGVALRDPLAINFLNPASYSSVDTNSFVFDLGLEYQITRLVNATEKYYSDDMNFHHLILAFPITKKMGFATGIMPYSNGYYNVRSTITETHPEYDPVIGETVNTHKGEGNLNKFFFGIGVSPLKNLALGVNMSFLFGELERKNAYTFLEDNNYFNNLASEKMNIRGINFDLGAQYNASFDNDYYLNAGFVFTNEQDYKTEFERLFGTYSVYQNTEYSIDTLVYNTDDNASVTMARSLTLGLSFGKKDVFTISADYSTSNWADSEFLGYEQYFTDRKTISGGIEFIPNKFANFNYLNRVEYRLGGHYTKSHLVVFNERLKEFGITFGVGLPMKRTNSRININFEYGRMAGSYENGLHRENLFIFGASLNFYDNWFLKKKYN